VQGHRQQRLRPLRRVQRPLHQRGQQLAGGQVGVELEARQQAVDREFVAEGRVRAGEGRRLGQATRAVEAGGERQRAAQAGRLVPGQLLAAPRAQVQPVDARLAADQAAGRQQA
jgi:hypothetical protein